MDKSRLAENDFYYDPEDGETLIGRDAIDAWRQQKIDHDERHVIAQDIRDRKAEVLNTEDE
jgi:hypothetical protein